MAMAWNTRNLAREAFVEALEPAGLEPVDGGRGWSFSHQVDRSITRDVMIARRPGQTGALDFCHRAPGGTLMGWESHRDIERLLYRYAKYVDSGPMG